MECWGKQKTEMKKEQNFVCALTQCSSIPIFHHSGIDGEE